MNRSRQRILITPPVIAVLMSILMLPTVWGEQPKLLPLASAWAANSVNAAVFRNDPISTHGDGQYAAFYDVDGRIVIATRTIGQVQWTTTVTSLTGNIKDAHNVISMIADGEGYLHVSWDHHGHPLRYVRSKAPGARELGEKIPMSGKNESNVTYPQFFRLPDGDLVFLFRDGASGRGNLVLNRYSAKAQTWTQVQENLISGQNKRNAYPQACVDGRGSIHVSWVWRETPDVASNHDLCYARSDDGGVTWKRSDSSPYKLPITAATAEIASAIPQKHELINQTSMSADEQGRPIIATYFRPRGEKVPQYFVIHHDGRAWKTVQASRRKTPFSLSGGGSKAIPVSRPQVVSKSEGGRTRVALIYRDVERETRVSVAQCADLGKNEWTVRDLTDFSVQYWEPTYDRVRWQRDGILNLYVQICGQGDAETLQKMEPQMAYVLEWKPW